MTSNIAYLGSVTPGSAWCVLREVDKLLNIWRQIYLPGDVNVLITIVTMGD